MHLIRVICLDFHSSYPALLSCQLTYLQALKNSLKEEKHKCFAMETLSNAILLLFLFLYFKPLLYHIEYSY